MKALERSVIASFIFFLLIFLSENEAQSQSPRLYINEFMASNSSTIADGNGEFDDWIEIFNGETFDIDLSGYFLTDNLANPQKWAFPNITLHAKSYLLVWADDQTNQSGCHANFKLDKDGEQLGLYGGSVLIDSVTFGPQRTDVSFGRRSDGDNSWVFYEPGTNGPTPGAANHFVATTTLNPPEFSLGDGFYVGPIAVELRSDDPAAAIHYTLDGSLPTASSPKYSTPIHIDAPTVVRAMCRKQISTGQYQTSVVESRCYLIDVANSMPFIDIICDQREHDRIYAWPQPGEPHGAISGQLKIFDSNHVLQADLPIELSMRGGYSLLSPKKSYQIDFVAQNLQYDLFDQDYNAPRSTGLPNSFHSINLSGMAADFSLIRNFLSFHLLRRIGAVSPQIAFVRLFINGQDRGIYVAMERIDQWLVKNRFSNAKYDIIKTGIEHHCNLTWDNENGQYFELKSGDFNAFNDLISWLNNKERSYEELSSKLDIPSFLYYDLMCRFSNNKDSYDINYYLIRNREQPNSKWTILLWDCDESFGWDSHVSGNWFPHNRAFDLLRNTPEYQRLYYNTLADLFNSRWSQVEISDLIDRLDMAFQTDNPADEAIWNEIWSQYAAGVIPDFEQDPNYHPLSRHTQFEYIKQWVGERIAYEFALWSEGTVVLTVDQPVGGEGAIQLNSLKLSNFPWRGRYFKNLDLQVTALPGPGFLFNSWSDLTLPKSESITITLQHDYCFHPIFKPNVHLDRLVINEINYNSAPNFDPEDWIELYNPADQSIDVSNWILKDRDDSHQFVVPSGTVVAPKGYLVICRDMTAFRRLFPRASTVTGDMNFSLNNDGDEVRLYHASGALVDSVSFGDRDPWPSLADGKGATLELIDPTLNNTVAASWQASLWHGTPGLRNSFPLVITEINYHSGPGFNTEDWVELYNPTSRIVDVSGCHLQHLISGHDFYLPSGTSIPSNGFVIICQNKNKFRAFFPGVANVVGDVNFSFIDSGDEIRLLDLIDNVIDSVRYDVAKPWPIEANGQGATLELLDPSLDNTIPRHWQASAGHGSPGQLTRALPVVTRFVVRDSSGSRLVTDSRNVLVDMAATDFDGQIVGWHINETGLPPAPGDFWMPTPPKNYIIQSPPGVLRIYGWVLDNDHQVSRVTDTSRAAIRLRLSEELYSVEGTVTYFTNNRPVPNAKIELKIDQESDWDSTDVHGNFRFIGVDSGKIILQPAKQGDIRQAIRCSDVLAVLAGLADPRRFNPEQRSAANVIDDAALNVSDARAILRYLVCRNDNIGQTGHWRFVPAETSFVLNQNINQHFQAYISGDVDLNWGSDSLVSQISDSTIVGISLKLGQVENQGAQFITVPLSAEIAHGAFYSMMISLQYETTYLAYQWCEPTDASKKFIVEDNGGQPGKLQIAMAGLDPIVSSNVVLKLHFKVLTTGGGRTFHTQLLFTRSLVNDLPVKSHHGIVILTDISDFEVPLPMEFKLFQNYPNPFNFQTQIRYQLASPGATRLCIYNLMGHRVRVLVNEQYQAAGTYQFNWDGRDENGQMLPSGIYLYELRSGGLVKRNKMVMVK
ncbi:MAG: lamin tail domain-containing protein [candidate division KSB1 bacterium]|nr:lamin tail domain-containing protein [candidate division KSB1 bacterium]